MPDIPSLIQSGTANVWLLLPVAILLGALHALEPGHSKSMMTAFIVAIHGTAAQAILLALSATVSHTMIVWVLAILAWRFQDATVLQRAEPWLLFIGGLLIVILALRILARLEHRLDHHSHSHGHHKLHHSHSHEHLDEDAHAAAHAAQFNRQLSKGPVTDVDVAWFGFSGGLYPCPAAFAVLLACFHQQAYALGIIMVLAFSVGLAIMLIGVGLIASWGANALASLGLDRFASWAPFASAAIMLSIGLVVTAQGLAALQIV